MKIAHLSDFHVSTFGETFHDRAHAVQRGNQPVDFSADKYLLVWTESGWHIFSEINKKEKETLWVSDPEGYVHQVPKRAEKSLTRKEQLISYARRTHQRWAKTLATDLPSSEQAQQYLKATPSNTNLRLVLASQFVPQDEFPLLVVSGDLTDDGDGYELIEAIFAPWIQQGRFLAVPGNHDRFLFPFASNTRPKPTRESKGQAWQGFARRLGLELNASGAWVKEFPASRCVIVGFDSCATGQRKFFLHSGEIGSEQLHFLSGVSSTSGWQNALHRIVVMHHHLTPMSLGIGKGSPTEIGMRLDDAVEVAHMFNQVGVTLVLHGHRHISETRQPAGCNFQILSAPSLTIGCRSGDDPSFWSIELGARAHWSRTRISLPPWKSQPLTEGM